ncbi:MAG: MBOAT family protein [Deltaproteobacteria bacterium]|nr:MBOAT family protein [Deltaproteobacteria bacterium]
MLFFQVSFLFVFLPLTLVLHQLLPPRVRNAALLAASLIFYATSSYEFLPLLLLSVVVDYSAGRQIGRSDDPATRRAWLIASLTTNLGLLAFYKYVGLISLSLRDLLGPEVPLLEAALPLGISFFTFQSMSYTIDVYRGDVEPAQSPVDFAAFVALFPQLVAGPIVRFRDVAPQLVDRTVRSADVVRGLTLFMVGLAKKILLADTLALLAKPLFAVEQPGFLDAWAGMVFYSGQIYFDFSGYSDMAVGLGLFLGFSFPNNFNAPYRARTFSDFWRRWHITLSSWLRDYLYIPLGGSRRGPLRTYVNLTITMLLGGLWHGASWAFVVWGAGHGLLLAAERALGERNPILRLPAVGQTAVTFLLVTALWVPFHFNDMTVATRWLTAMVFGHGVGSITPLVAGSVAAALALFHLPTPSHLWDTTPRPRLLLVIVFLFVLSLFVAHGRLEAPPFLYFRF